MLVARSMPGCRIRGRTGNPVIAGWRNRRSSPGQGRIHFAGTFPSHVALIAIIPPEVTIRAWGNDAAARLRSAAMQAAKRKLDAAVEVRAAQGRLVIEPVREMGIALADITGENVHGGIATNPPRGDESLRA